MYLTRDSFILTNLNKTLPFTAKFSRLFFHFRKEEKISD